MGKRKLDYVPGVYVADTENTVPKTDLYWHEGESIADYYERINEQTSFESSNVWALAAAPVKEHPVESDMFLTNNMDDFLDYFFSKKQKKIKVYFHNLAYDGVAIVDHLLRKGYILVEGDLWPAVQDLFEKEILTYVYDESVNYTFLLYDYEKAGSNLLPKCLKFDPNADGNSPRKNTSAVVVNEKWTEPRCVRTLISGENVWYEIKLYPDEKYGEKVITIWDSLKIIPASVKKIGEDFKCEYEKLSGEIDYSLYRPEGWEITPEEKRYILSDVMIMSQALYKVKDYGLLSKMTIGSVCMVDYKKRLTPGAQARQLNNKFREKFPLLDSEMDRELRKAYHGAFCMVNPKYADQVINCVDDDTYKKILKCEGILQDMSRVGHVYDVNSLYPSVMYDHLYPFGVPIEVLKPEDNFDKYANTPYIIKIEAAFEIKPDHIPSVMEKDGKKYGKATYYTTSVSMEGDEEHITKTLTMTRPEYELFFEQYDVHYLRIIKMWTFAGANNLFNNYIDYWYGIKEEATKTGNAVLRQVAKLMLNNLYGKFATNPQGSTGTPYIGEDNIIHLRTADEERQSVYIPVGAFITAYARAVTIRACQKNFHNWLYSDTDSIHIIGPAVGIEVDPVKLGAWDHESTFIKARFVRQKTYCEINYDKKSHGAYVNLKACGATEHVKQRIQHKCSKIIDGKEMYQKLDEIYYYDNGKRKVRYEVEGKTAEKYDYDELLDRFTYGLRTPGKLKKSRTVGAAYLSETYFQILRSA